MKKAILIFSIICISFCSFKLMPYNILANGVTVYNGHDLGVNYQPLQTTFKIWSPTATVVKLRLYKAGNGSEAIQTIILDKKDNGIWQTVVHENLKNQYYTFQAQIGGKWLLESPDIYAKAVGVNGKRGMVVNLTETNPFGWENDKKPALKSPTDIILYETHIRDISVSANSGIKNKGKFLGFTETGTKSPEGEPTGLDHLKQLGVTHIHLLPSFDFSSVDEASNKPQFNWGYDPLNYNVPEGSYATNAYDGNVRIREFKQLVQTLHKNGLRVVLDVVYNHTSNAQLSGFDQFAPGYFYRHKADGGYSDATACGNETASEQPMMRKFMIESVVYWAKEYHLDGFRFDLMGVHDIETMNAISDTLHKIDPTIYLYGEGWTAGDSPLSENLRAVKKNVTQLHQIAAFSDDIRDGLRGAFNDMKTNGFVSGAHGTTESIKFGIVASTQHSQVDYSKVNYSKAPWALQPYQTINYVSCHDDATLFDRLKISNPEATEAELIKMDKLANAIVITSQGVPFLHSGSEMLRSKKGVANSYNAPDSINELDWSRKTKYKPVFNYYCGLIALRKAHPAFRMPSTAMIQNHLEFIPTNNESVITYHLKDNANGDSWKDIIVILNGGKSEQSINVPPGSWTLVVNGDLVNQKGIRTLKTATINVPATTAYILFQN